MQGGRNRRTKTKHGGHGITVTLPSSIKSIEFFSSYMPNLDDDKLSLIYIYDYLLEEGIVIQDEEDNIYILIKCPSPIRIEALGVPPPISFLHPAFRCAKVLSPI